MPKFNLTSATVPYAVERALKRLGANIALARQRRGMRQTDLANKAGITAVTMRRVENGMSTTGIAAYLAALWALGLESEFADIASPDRDEEGKTRERARSPERVRLTAQGLSDEF